jgi:hypothetical protein
MSWDGEIVGLEGEECCHFCESHDEFGNHLSVGELGKFKVTMSLVGEEHEVVIKVVKIRDGNEICHVGLLPLHIGYGSRNDKLMNIYAPVLEIYKHSKEFTKKRKNHRLVDVDSYRILDNIQDLE